MHVKSNFLKTKFLKTTKAVVFKKQQQNLHTNVFRISICVQSYVERSTTVILLPVVNFEALHDYKCH